MLDRAQPAEQPVELVVADGQRIAAREQHVADFGVLFEIGQRLFPLAGRELVFAARIADHARARAIAAIGRAGAGGQEQHAVGIAMDQARARPCRGPRPADRRPRPAARMYSSPVMIWVRRSGSVGSSRPIRLA